jgi:hypothetical protein
MGIEVHCAHENRSDWSYTSHQEAGERSNLSANTRCRRSMKSCALSRKRAVSQRIVDADSLGLEE